MFKIYLAGPLFSSAERQFNLSLAEKIVGKISDCTILLPQEFTKDLIGHESFHRETFLRCIRKIDECDLLLAVLEGADVDSGTCLEIGYAYASGKPIVGLRTDFRTSEEKGVNLMISQACREIIWEKSSGTSMAEIVEKVTNAVNLQKH